MLAAGRRCAMQRKLTEERWPVKPGRRLLTDGRLCGLYEKIRGKMLPTKQKAISVVSFTS